MRVLLDTHILLWALVEPDRMHVTAQDLLESPETQVFFSAANIWEIAIKRTLNRPDFDAEPDAIRIGALQTGFEELPVTGVHAVAVRHLPNHHRDPFDRLLIAQAQTEPLLLITDDPVMAQYSVGIWRNR